MERRRRKYKGRRVNGILLLDKPEKISSNEALQYVKRIFKADKAGHTGSLDPLATGLLPVCFGEATKISAYLLDADKSYQTTIKLGEKTDTADADGTILATASVADITKEQIEEALNHYRGKIEQLPPMYSAIKYKGKRLYQLARQGIEVQRELRTVQIHSLELLSFSNDLLEVEIHCSKGTYIRTLADDLGEQLGCYGHVYRLRRTGVGPFQLTDALTFKQLEDFKDADFRDMDKLLLPLDKGLMDWPRVKLNEDSAYYLKMGQPVLSPGAPVDGMVRIYDAEDRFLGVGEINHDGLVSPKRLII